MKYKRIDKIAQITGFGKSTIRRYIKLYKLPHYRLGGREEIAMTDEQIEQLLDSSAHLRTKP